MKIYITTITILLFAVAAYSQAQMEVKVPSTFLRKAPDGNSEKIQTVLNGEKITLEKTQDTNGWYFVSIGDGRVKGWIRKDTVISAVAAEKMKSKPQKTVSPVPIVIAPAAETTQSTISPKSVTTSPASSAETLIEDDEVLRVDTEEINLNVRVVNGSNRPVGDLNQAQFEVYEDDVLQPITYFTRSEVPIISALVIDNSRSLRFQLKKVIEAGKIILETNRSKDESTIVRFVSKDKIEVVQDFTPNKNSLNDALDNLFVEGGQTAIIDAIYLTAKKVERYQETQGKEDAKLRTLILVTDGDDRGSTYREQQLFELLRELHVQIYVIGFVNDLSKEKEAGNVSRQDKARAFITRLAEETGGKFYFPNSIDELPQIASDISSEQRMQYLISYTPTNENRDGTFRKIKVIVADGTNKEKRIAITRTGRNSLIK